MGPAGRLSTWNSRDPGGRPARARIRDTSPRTTPSTAERVTGNSKPNPTGGAANNKIAVRKATEASRPM